MLSDLVASCFILKMAENLLHKIVLLHFSFCFFADEIKKCLEDITKSNIYQFCANTLRCLTIKYPNKY